jgi:hypothetical protein
VKKKEVVMLRKTMVVLVVALGLGSFGLSAAALARGGGSGGDHVTGGFEGRRAGGSGSGLHRGFHGYGRPDVWGHRGAYYGPMIPPI